MFDLVLLCRPNFHHSSPVTFKCYNQLIKSLMLERAYLRRHRWWIIDFLFVKSSFKPEFKNYRGAPDWRLFYACKARSLDLYDVYWCKGSSTWTLFSKSTIKGTWVETMIILHSACEVLQLCHFMIPHFDLIQYEWLLNASCWCCDDFVFRLQIKSMDLLRWVYKSAGPIFSALIRVKHVLWGCNV